MEKSERVASSPSLARPLRAEKRASTTDSNGEREREREGRGNEIRLLPLHYLRPSSSLRRVMVRVRDDSERAFSTRPSNFNFGSKSVILPVHVSMLASFD